jgi:threonyl-tRNA synthetase
MERPIKDMAENIEIALPDGSRREVPGGTTIRELAALIGPGLGRVVVAGKVNGEVVDQRFVLTEDCAVVILTPRDPEALEVLRHSAAHLMAMAVQRVRPGVNLAFGPPVEDGFYYDFEVSEPFREEDFAAIEEEMGRIVKADLPYERSDVSKAEAKRILSEMGETLKVEHVDDIPGETVSFYENGDFRDLCQGPHVRSTGEIKAFRLLKTSSAYWKGDAANAVLSRVYGTAFFDKKELKKHLTLLAERKKRDHRRLGTELDLFSFQPEAPGMAFWHEKGAILYQDLLDYFRHGHEERGYRIVRTPLVMSEELWKKSGHYDHYKDSMFFVDTEEGRWALKPMNCPGHNLIYRTRVRSYRDLPLRLTEAGQVHRNELSGVVGGLTRVRSFAIDDAHIYCTPEQLCDEILGVMDFVLKTYRDFSFPDYEVELSTRPLTGSIGSDEMWENATSALTEALERHGGEYRISPGDGAFYGPKIDFHLKDSLNRRWQCGTIQVDFAMPERFDLEYVGSDGDRHRPVMVHRAIFGSLERFIAVLIEHHAGKLPVWLSPVQAVVMNITDAQADGVAAVHGKLVAAGIRSRLDLRNEKIGRKIREATLEKIPYMLVLGDREVEEGTVSVRDRTDGDLGTFSIEDFVARVKEEIRQRR